jgi:tetratricopeptide (TPR) repeat protein
MDAALKPGRPRKIGRYDVIRELGRGGMGAVYAVADPATGTRLALKRLDAGDRTRFRREFNTLAHLAHPRVVSVHEYGETDGRPFYTMELLDGRDLRDMACTPPEDACRLARDIAAGLAFLHSRRLLHRDLSPRNVRCTSDGRAKLIDFGLLATIGTTRDVAGTPPFTAPEVVRGMPLDPRTDLFGIGALLYWLLTGTYAFGARTFGELEAAWKNRPLPPSAVVAAVPPALDDLVLSLLRIDPLGRPATAAEVIDRLGAIAGLPPLTDAEVARGYLASTALVGRVDEMRRLRKFLDSALRGRGRGVILEGPSGGGKSRILRELRLEAQLAGAAVVEIDATSAGTGPVAGLRQLTRELLAACPEETLAAARPRAPIVGRVLPELVARLGKIVLAPPAGDPAEDRMRLSAALAELILAIAAARPLVVLVDDVQRIDELSAAVLAAVAQAAAERKIAICATLRTDDDARAPDALAALRESSARIAVTGLSAGEVGELVRELFGALTDGALVARKVYDTAGGQPLHVIEALHALVADGALRYADGAWSIHRERLERFAIPRELAAAIAVRIARLPPAARELAEALSVHDGELPFELCNALAGDAALAAIGDLVAAEVLVGGGDRYRFRHDSVRRALGDGLSDAQRAQLHAQIARAMPESADDAALGWHLLRGGSRLRGARLLDRAGRRQFEAYSFRDAIPLIEAALEVYNEQHVEAGSAVELRHMLLAAGCMADRAVVLAWADESLATLRRQAGMDAAKHASRVVGKKLGVIAGVIWAGLRWLVARPSRRGPGPSTALRQFFLVYGYAITGYAVSFRLDDVRAVRRYAEPLRAFEGRVPYAAYLVIEAMLAFQAGRAAEVRTACTEALAILERDRLTRISDIDRKNMKGPALYLLALMAAIEERPEADALLAELDALDMHFYRTAGLVARIARHRYRGEEADARRLEARLARYRVQLGSVWQMDAQLAMITAVGYGWTGDVAGMRRAIATLEEMVDAGYRLEPMLELARGEYHRDRGEPALGVEHIRRALAMLPAELPGLKLALLASLADTLLAAGEPAAAADVARDGLALNACPELAHDVLAMRMEIALARAEAALGEPAAALARIARVDTGVAANNPVVRGATAEVRARIALAAGDHAEVERQALAMASWFRRTHNPVLIARVEALAERTNRPRAQARVSVDGAETTAVTVAAKVRASAGAALLSGLRDGETHGGRALEIVLETARAQTGALFLLRDDAVAVAAGEPPPWLAPFVERAVAAFAHRDASNTFTEIEWARVPDHDDWRIALLTAPLATRDIVVGAIAIYAAGAPPDALLLVQLARELYHAGDATGVLVEGASARIAAR